MLRKIIRVFLAVLVALVAGCAKKEYIVEKKPAEILEMFENKQDFVLFCGTQTCETCAKFRPVMEQVCEKWGVKVYYMDVTDYDSEEIKNLTYNYLYTLEWTPTVYVVDNGRVTAMNENDNDTLLSYGKLLRWLEDNHAIP